MNEMETPFSGVTKQLPAKPAFSFRKFTLRLLGGIAG